VGGRRRGRQPQFTHASWNDYRIIRANLVDGDAVTTGRLVPYTVFTTPELARIGLTETQARAEGRAITVAYLDVSTIPRAKTLRQPAGAHRAAPGDQQRRSADRCGRGAVS
jgi:pyruvate/2-oxoglutarate dehydrogenase complex dihydrolipoamide dehydrogenase (E3) component